MVIFILNEFKVEFVKLEVLVIIDVFELSIRMFLGLLLLKEGVGICCVMYEVDVWDLVCIFIFVCVVKVW